MRRAKVRDAARNPGPSTASPPSYRSAREKFAAHARATTAPDRGRDQNSPLILAEHDRCRIGGGRQRKPGADRAGKRHLGDRDQRAAIGNVVNRGDQALRDQLRGRDRQPALDAKVDRRRSAFAAAVAYLEPQ